jgi:hypothetical protein
MKRPFYAGVRLVQATYFYTRRSEWITTWSGSPTSA